MLQYVLLVLKDVSHVQTTVTLLMMVPLYAFVMMDTIELTLKMSLSHVQVAIVLPNCL